MYIPVHPLKFELNIFMTPFAYSKILFYLRGDDLFMLFSVSRVLSLWPLGSCRSRVSKGIVLNVPHPPSEQFDFDVIGLDLL